MSLLSCSRHLEACAVITATDNCGVNLARMASVGGESRKREDNKQNGEIGDKRDDGEGMMCNKSDVRWTQIFDGRAAVD